MWEVKGQRAAAPHVMAGRGESIRHLLLSSLPFSLILLSFSPLPSPSTLHQLLHLSVSETASLFDACVRTTVPASAPRSSAIPEYEPWRTLACLVAVALPFRATATPRQHTSH